jgi:hypothetical protein
VRRRGERIEAARFGEARSWTTGCGRGSWGLRTGRALVGWAPFLSYIVTIDNRSDCNAYTCIYDKILQRMFQALPGMYCYMGGFLVVIYVQIVIYHYFTSDHDPYDVL